MSVTPGRGLVRCRQAQQLSFLSGGAQGEFHLLAKSPEGAPKRFEKAVELARSRTEVNFFGRELKACQRSVARG